MPSSSCPAPPACLWREGRGGGAAPPTLRPQKGPGPETRGAQLNRTPAAPRAYRGRQKGELLPPRPPAATQAARTTATTRVGEPIQAGIPRTSWYANSPNLTKATLGASSYINQLSYAVNISTTAIVGTNDGNVQMGFGLGQGTANSATWVNVTLSN